MAHLYDLCLHPSAEETQLIQRLHITAAHIIGAVTEYRLFPRDMGRSSC